MAKKIAKTEPDATSVGPAKKNGESISSYFRKVFDENPKLLDSRSNDELLKRWLDDHPGQTEVPKNIKGNLANLKSVLRSKGRKKTAAKAARVQAAAPAGSKPVTRSTLPKTQLEKLEEQIDDCLTSARVLDREGLEDVILHLRKARNAVVWKMGQ